MNVLDIIGPIVVLIITAVVIHYDPDKKYMKED